MAEKKQSPAFDKKKIIEKLNQVLEQEHACAIRYGTHAALVKGPYAEDVMKRLEEIAGDEIDHAKKLRDRITALGGTPSMAVSQEDLHEARELKRILHVNIQEEKEAIAKYRDILLMIPRTEVILFETVEHILKDEQEHLEELERLNG